MSFNTQSINHPTEISLVEQARWYSVFHKITPCHMAPEINLNPPPLGVAATAAIMCASGKMDNIWEPYTEEELTEALRTYHANISDYTPIDLNLTLEQLVESISEQRILTRQELILVMKCDYLKACRQNSDHENDIKPCGELNKHCVCNYMK